MDLELAAKRAIVTGGSRGIGRVIAGALAAEGVRVVIAARTPEPLEKAAAALTEQSGGDVRAVAADTTDDASVRALVERTVAEFGGIDILVNNAAVPGGIGGRAALADVRDEDVLSDLDTFQICTAYEIDGEKTTDFPGDAFLLEKYKPVYETLPGWSEPLDSCNSASDLPAAARAYVDFVERELGVAVSLVGTGAERESVLSRA